MSRCLPSCCGLSADPGPETADEPRIAVIIPCHGEGRMIAEAVASIQEPEPIHIIVVDDASPDEETQRTLSELEAAGTAVLRLGQNRGVGRARWRSIQRFC